VALCYFTVLEVIFVAIARARLAAQPGRIGGRCRTAPGEAVEYEKFKISLIGNRS
jgi:hypothetical protein